MDVWVGYFTKEKSLIEHLQQLDLCWIVAQGSQDSRQVLKTLGTNHLRTSGQSVNLYRNRTIAVLIKNVEGVKSYYA